MKIAFIVFDGVTWIDIIGVYDPITRLKSMGYIPHLSWDFCSYKNEVSDNFGLRMVNIKIKPNLAEYDAIIVPGGLGARRLQFDNHFIDWIRTSLKVKYKISVCSGALIFGAAGFLGHKKATTHFLELNALKPYCKNVVNERIVEDGTVITSGGVSASIDLGLYLCEKWAGKDAAEKIRERMAYKQ
jgi:cyclohexyl-isocyanide hydratase